MFGLTEASTRRRPVCLGRPIAASSGSILAGESFMLKAEKHFRRVRGYRDLQRLLGALDAMGPPDGVIADVA